MECEHDTESGSARGSLLASRRAGSAGRAILVQVECELNASTMQVEGCELNASGMRVECEWNASGMRVECEHEHEHERERTGLQVGALEAPGGQFWCN